MTAIRALFFDLDETLLDDNTGFELAVARSCIDLAHRFDGIDPHGLRAIYCEASDAFWRELGAGQPWSAFSQHSGAWIRESIWRAALERVGRDDAAILATATNLYAEHRRRGYAPFDDVAGVLASLQMSCVLAVVSNGFHDVQEEKLGLLGIQSYFQLLVAAGNFGAGKPDPAIFCFALDKLGLEPGDVWHVGDSLAADVAGAKAAGLTAVWLNRHGAQRGPDDPRPDVEIASLAELPALLEIER